MPSRGVPSEEDILKWLNDGVDEEYIAARPRVASAGLTMKPAGNAPSDPSHNPDPTPTRNVDSGGHDAQPMIRRQHDGAPVHPNRLAPSEPVSDTPLLRKTG
jgi:hypothetical protein